MIQTTLTILKPDSLESGNAGAIIARLEEKGFRLRGLRLARLTEGQARAFYEVHRERPFYESLVTFMTRGPVVVAALERENAVAHLREVMGATNPADAAAGTIRADFASSIEENAIHGSDSPENAAREVAFFFAASDLIATSGS